MTDHDQRRSEADAEIEREIRQGRKLGPKDLLARMAGPGALKGASPISPVQQAETEIGIWLGKELRDHDGALRVVLHRHLKGSERLLASLDRPFVALADYLRGLLAADSLLKEIVGEADIEWGRAMDERPHFERDGAPPHPDDPYTLEGVRTTLRDALARLPGADG
ncbi:MAG TPA: hypothetical protein VI168_15990 [Croceibacterium sp.]